MVSRVCKEKVLLESGAFPIVAFYLSLGHYVVTQDPAVQQTGCLRTYACHILASTRDKLGFKSIPRRRICPGVKVRYLLDMLHHGCLI